MGAFLGLLPRTRRALQPREVWDLAEGDQQRWNRLCLLIGWSTWLICNSIPRLAKGSDWRSQVGGFEGFMRQMGPPGYRPPPATDTKRRKRNG